MGNRHNNTEHLLSKPSGSEPACRTQESRVTSFRSLRRQEHQGIRYLGLDSNPLHFPQTGPKGPLRPDSARNPGYLKLREKSAPGQHRRLNKLTPAGSSAGRRSAKPGYPGRGSGIPPCRIPPLTPDSGCLSPAGLTSEGFLEKCRLRIKPPIPEEDSRSRTPGTAAQG